MNFFQASLRNCINCVHCDDHFFISTPSIVGCYMLRPHANNVECCCMLLRVVWSCSAKFETGQKFEPTNALPNISFVRDRRSVAKQCWIHFHTSSNIVVVGHARALHKDTPHKTIETIPRCTAGPNTAWSY